MNLKKLAVLGAVALVVIGCVVAAGCTSTGTETAAAEDQITGTWSDDTGESAFIFLEDNTGSMYQYNDGLEEVFMPITWKKNSDGTYEVTLPENETVTVTVDTVKGRITTDSGSVYTKDVSDASGALVNKKKKIQFIVKPVITFERSLQIGSKLIDEGTTYTLATPSDGVLEYGYSLAKEYRDDSKLNYNPDYYVKQRRLSYPENWTVGNVTVGDEVQPGDYIYIWCRIKDNDSYYPYYMGYIYYSGHIDR